MVPNFIYFNLILFYLYPLFSDRLRSRPFAAVAVQDAQRCATISSRLSPALYIIRHRCGQGLLLLCRLTDRTTETELDSLSRVASICQVSDPE